MFKETFALTPGCESTESPNAPLISILCNALSNRDLIDKHDQPLMTLNETTLIVTLHLDEHRSFEIIKLFLEKKY